MVNKTIKKGERGINYLKTIVDQYECFFHKNDQENDVGLDCFIEFTKNGDETGKIVAIQVKMVLPIILKKFVNFQLMVTKDIGQNVLFRYME